MAPKITIYTDGACSGNPGPGGWGALLIYGDMEKELSGKDPATTNNRMELMAVIQALQSLKKSCDVIVYTDSQYVRQGITEWLPLWMKNGWKNARKEPVKNQDLWQDLYTACLPHKITWKWVRGHSGDPLNERVDALARKAIGQKDTLSF